MPRNLSFADYDHGLYRTIRFALVMGVLVVILRETATQYDWTEHRVELIFAAIFGAGSAGGKWSFGKMAQAVGVANRIMQGMRDG